MTTSTKREGEKKETQSTGNKEKKNGANVFNFALVSGDS